MFHSLILLLLLCAYLIQRKYRSSKYPHNRMLTEIYKHLITLYPKTYFFGIRIIHHPKEQPIHQELSILGLSQINQIEENNISVWINSSNDIFIVQAVCHRYEREFLMCCDAQLGRYFFYAYESIITIPVNANHKDLMTYLRQLSLWYTNPKTTTSIWLTKCESLPGYNHFQEQFPQKFQTINQECSLPDLMNDWINRLHHNILNQIPINISPTLKGEFIGTAHQLSHLLKSIEPQLKGRLAKRIHFGYIMMVNTTENHDLLDRLYEHWRVAPKDLVMTTPSGHSWTELFSSFPEQNSSLQGVFISLSLFTIFALTAKLIEERSGHQNHFLKDNLSQLPQNILTIENQLLSEMGSTIDPKRLLQLASLHHSMLSLPADKDRCQKYQSLVQKSINCQQIDNVKLNPLPEDLMTRSHQIFSSLSSAEKIDLITPPVDESIQISILNFNAAEACIKNELLMTFKAEIFPKNQCASQIKSTYISTLAMQQLDQISRHIIPISSNDPIDMLINKTEYYSHHIEEMIGDIPSQLNQLHLLSQSHQLDYKIQARIKSLNNLTNYKKDMEKTLEHANALLEKTKTNTNSKIAQFYKDSIMTDPLLTKTLLQKPLDAKEEWIQSIYHVILDKIKETVAKNIQAAYHPLYENHEKFLKNKFPLNSSAPDADPEVFQQLLSPNGAFVDFFNTHIIPLVNEQHTDWIWENQTAFALPLDKNLLNTQMQVALINEMFFHKKPQTWFESSIKITRSSPNLQFVTIQTGNQSQTLQINAGAQIIRWLSMEPNHNFSSIALEYTDGSKSQIPFYGEFSGLHLLQSLEMINKLSNQHFHVRISKDEGWVEFEIQLPHHINPLISGISDQLIMQERILTN